jgi:proline racemase
LTVASIPGCPIVLSQCGTHGPPSARVGAVAAQVNATLIAPKRTIPSDGLSARRQLQPGSVDGTPAPHINVLVLMRGLLLHADGRLSRGDELVTTSPSGSPMSGTVRDATVADGVDAVHVAITGRAFTLGRTEVVVNLDDPTVETEAVRPLLDVSTR